MVLSVVATTGFWVGLAVGRLVGCLVGRFDGGRVGAVVVGDGDGFGVGAVVVGDGVVGFVFDGRPVVGWVVGVDVVGGTLTPIPQHVLAHSFQGGLNILHKFLAFIDMQSLCMSHNVAKCSGSSQ